MNQEGEVSPVAFLCHWSSSLNPLTLWRSSTLPRALSFKLRASSHSGKKMIGTKFRFQLVTRIAIRPGQIRAHISAGCRFYQYHFMYRRPRLRRHKFIPSDTRIDENTAIHGHFIRYRYGRLNVLSSSVLYSPGTDFHAVVQPERVHFAQTKKVYVPPVVLRNTFTTMNFPPEIYEHILFYLPLPDLIRAGRTCRSFYQISRWCLESKEYIGRWRVSFQENGGTRRMIPIDLDKSERRLEKEGGFYVFNARIKPISWMNEILHIDLAFLNLRVLCFGLRFMDHGDLSPSEDIESNPPPPPFNTESSS